MHFSFSFFNARSLLMLFCHRNVRLVPSGLDWLDQQPIPTSKRLSVHTQPGTRSEKRIITWRSTIERANGSSFIMLCSLFKPDPAHNTLIVIYQSFTTKDYKKQIFMFIVTICSVMLLVRVYNKSISQLC